MIGTITVQTRRISDREVLTLVALVTDTRHGQIITDWQVQRWYGIAVAPIVLFSESATEARNDADAYRAALAYFAGTTYPY